MKVNVFLPCKKNSTRVKNKNKRRFAKADNSLIKIKLNQLINAKLIDKTIRDKLGPKVVTHAQPHRNSIRTSSRAKSAHTKKLLKLTIRLLRSWLSRSRSSRQYYWAIRA